MLEYDDVMNKQREVIYAERRRVLEGQSLRSFFLDTLRSKVEDAVNENAPDERHPTEWDLPEILNELDMVYPVKQRIALEELEKLDRSEMIERLNAAGVEAYEAKEAEISPEIMRFVESRYIMLPIIDRMWVDHLYVMDALKTGIGLRGYGQKDPRVEYEKEAFEIFEDLKNNIADEAIKAVYAVKIERQEEPPPAEMQPAAQPQVPTHPGFEPLPSGAIAPQPAAGNGTVATAPMPQRTLDDETAAKLLGPVPRSRAAKCTRIAVTSSRRNRPRGPATRLGATTCARVVQARSTSAVTGPPPSASRLERVDGHRQRIRVPVGHDVGFGRQGDRKGRARVVARRSRSDDLPRDAVSVVSAEPATLTV